MRNRPTIKFHPGLERLEEKQPLSVSALTAPLASLSADSRALAFHQHETASDLGAAGAMPGDRGGPSRQHRSLLQGNDIRSRDAQGSISSMTVKPTFGYLVYRLVSPNLFNDKLIPPFQHVLVQSRQPVPGQVYNLLYLALRNGTARTFDASSGFTVKFPGNPTHFPILTGNAQWKPGQEFVFYVLTKKYYPMPSQVTSGFEFFLGGAKSTAIPGPSGIYVKLKYNPATFDRNLDAIVAFGSGAQGGKGLRFGMPDTAIYEFVSAATKRKDFGGYF